jgi:hypothetical protein
MSLSRKHYCAVAAILADPVVHVQTGPEYKSRPATPSDVRIAFIHEFANMFAADNPNFDRARFLAACKVQS